MLFHLVYHFSFFTCLSGQRRQYIDSPSGRDGFTPTPALGNISEINILGQQVSYTKGRETVRVALQEYTVPCTVRGDSHENIP